MVKTWFFAVCCYWTVIGFAQANTLRIASSANFSNTLQALTKEFAKQHPHRAKISTAATGVLYQQIRHGAPFDIFFSADVRHAQLLEQQQLIDESYRHTYAYGQLALWSNTEQSPISLDKLTDYRGRIAIAAPHIAPYGLAAKQVLFNKNLWSKYHNQLITGHNVNQTYQQTLTGAVAYGFICYSQLLRSNQGHGVLIDHRLHQPIEQQMVVLKNAKNHDLARAFFDFVLSDAGQQLITESGYLPAKHITTDANSAATASTAHHQMVNQQSNK
ncbi:molybdate ABC transporter substrate-binding protein [Thalassotalea maritima]|uniref:molybdate ABC transporter substrate-binding protein n=1 Tax=Thalassotalea maritima TaxID=3242416 RepID=UPI0035287E61